MPTDWSRLDAYAPRVKRLVRTSGLERISGDVYRALSIYRKGLLLPSLQELEWYELDKEIFPYAQLLLGHQLSAVATELIAEDSDSSFCAFLASIPNNSPRLQKLDIRRRSLRSQPTEIGHTIALSRTVCSLPYLQYLSCGPISLTNDAIQHLSKSSELRVLRLQNDTDSVLRALSGTQDSTRPFFPNLVHLTAFSSQLPPLSAVLGLIRPKILEGFDLYMPFNGPHNPSATEMREFFLSLEKFFPRASFSHIQILEYRDNLPVDIFDDAEKYLTLQTFQPLFTFTNLISINIALDYPFDLDDVAIRSMAIAWPRLQKLLSGGVHWGQDPMLTLNSLVSLATHCPDLNYLRLVLDASISRLESRDVEKCNHLITYLELGCSILDDANQVAAFLSRLFPNLTHIYAWEEHGDEGEDSEWFNKWADVQEFIEARAVGKRSPAPEFFKTHSCNQHRRTNCGGVRQSYRVPCYFQRCCLFAPARGAT